MLNIIQLYTILQSTITQTFLRPNTTTTTSSTISSNTMSRSATTTIHSTITAANPQNNSNQQPHRATHPPTQHPSKTYHQRHHTHRPYHDHAVLGQAVPGALNQDLITNQDPSQSNPPNHLSHQIYNIIQAV